ncbi:hypothetical protein BC826DRAFT_158259 [Russula brevipes]|nr:hypothetical protein BC826DRAFT_158259 [Russula brevipes]
MHEFMKRYLEGGKFLYEESNGKDKKKWKGLFRGPFVLQTFATHLAAIEGSVPVMILDPHGKPTTAAVGGLGLAAASVERALSLVATGTLTVSMAYASKGKMVTVPRTVNHSTGKVPMQQTGFSDAAWGHR